MSKIRKLSSVENGLAEAIKKLKAEVIEKATGKSISFIRKCSDPDLKQQLDHKDAVNIDIACLENELPPYLLRAHEYIILKELKKVKHNNYEINELLVKFTILHGELMNAINNAKKPEGDRGTNISVAEKKEIFDAFHALENKILKIKSTIENK